MVVTTVVVKSTVDVAGDGVIVGSCRLEELELEGS